MGAVDQNQDRQGLQQAGHGHHFIMTQRRKHSQKSYRRATFKRSDSTREESKKTKSHLDVLDTMKEKEGLKIALIVLNSQYKGRGYRNLQGVSKDGDLMGRMLNNCFDEDLKLELLKCSPKRLTLTLDCCRRRQRDKKEEYVILRHMEPIDESVVGKIAVIHGTQDLHEASDDDSFTQELYRIFEKANGNEIPIVDIAREVNKNWAQKGIKQKCKLDITETGNDWRFYMWPTSYICFPKQNLDKDGTDVAMDESVGENEESQDLNGTVRGLQKKYDDLVPLVGKISLLEKKVEKLENENQSLEDEVAARPRKKARRKNEETK